jgi:hypothetical protein
MFLTFVCHRNCNYCFPGRFLFVCRSMTIALGRSWVLVTIQYTNRHNDEGKKVGASFHIRIGWHLQVE